MAEIRPTQPLRAATPDDIPELTRLIDLSVRGLSVGYYDEEVIERSLVQIFGVDTQLITDGTYCVAEAHGAIIGCGGWSHRRTLFGGDQTKSQEDKSLDPRSEAARIRAFYVHPEHARQGLGSRILSHCEAAARAYGFTTAELGSTLPGEPLYAAYGYKPMERVDVDLGDGYSLGVIRMTKSLG
jgi:GNAT superfamily N-acetyltransferase